MRWNDLFDDLAGQFDAEYEAERRREAVDDERLRVARLTLRQRLATLQPALRPGECLSLELRGGERLEIEPTEFGADWFAARLAAPTRRYRSVLVPLAGISSLVLTRDQLERSLAARPEQPDSLAARLGLVIPLRDLTRRRVHVEVTTTLGVLHGTIDLVGRDHLDLAVHDGDTPRRNRDVAAYRMVPLDEVRLVRIDGDVTE
ncbi:hypothetical protein [Gulosibacter faecalis]|uniref:Uncharacterized protein n=1 Tax=Gulosibacter faecalis TaxID=272240 RepID=A0ABW5UZK8_9MICO|nr:hypothetical protein [Gulosibacter faecalis]